MLTCINMCPAKETEQTYSGSRIVNYVGWTGQGNVGDDALLVANQKVFNQFRLIPSFNSLARERPKLFSGISIFGGGTVLPRWSTQVMPNRYNFAYGVGAVDPDFFRFQYGANSKSLYEYAVMKTRKFPFKLIGVRGEQSRNLLKAWGIEATVVGDPCLLLQPSSYFKKEERLVAVSIGSSERIEPVWGNTKRIVQETLKLCYALKKDGYAVVLIPFSKDDTTYIDQISKETRLPIFNEYRDLQSLINFISTCQVLVGQRMHSTILSAAAYTPFLSISYHPKCQEFSESMGFQEFIVRAEYATSQRILSELHLLTKKWDQMYERLQEKVNMYRRRLTEFASEILADIESLPETKWLPAEPWKQAKFHVTNTLELHLPRVCTLLNRLPLQKDPQMPATNVSVQ